MFYESSKSRSKELLVVGFENLFKLKIKSGSSMSMLEKKTDTSILSNRMNTACG